MKNIAAIDFNMAYKGGFSVCSVCIVIVCDGEEVDPSTFLESWNRNT